MQLARRCLSSRVQCSLSIVSVQELESLLTAVNCGEKVMSEKRKQQVEKDLFELKAYLEQALSEAGTDAALLRFESKVQQLRDWRAAEMLRIDQAHKAQLQAAADELTSSIGGDSLPPAMHAMLGKVKSEFKTPRGKGTTWDQD